MATFLNWMSVWRRGTLKYEIVFRPQSDTPWKRNRLNGCECVSTVGVTEGALPLLTNNGFENYKPINKLFSLNANGQAPSARMRLRERP
jgi:hypothetical protein